MALPLNGLMPAGKNTWQRQAAGLAIPFGLAGKASQLQLTGKKPAAGLCLFNMLRFGENI
jgi:hypothetical protein